MTPASQVRATALLAVLVIWKWLPLWVGELDKVFLVDRSRPRDWGLSKGWGRMAYLYKKNEPLPLWQVAGRAESRLLFSPLLLPLSATQRHRHVPQGGVRTRSCPQKCWEGSPHRETCASCVRGPKREKGEEAGEKESGREEREHEDAGLFNYGVMSHIGKQETPWTSWNNLLDAVYIC